MLDNLLVDLMGSLDFGLLENDYMEEDLRKQQNISHAFTTKNRNMNRTTKFEIADSLRIAIREQKDRNELPEICERIDIRVDAVKNKVRKIRRIISGIIAMAVLMISVVCILIKKKSTAKLLQKKFQTV